MAKLRSQLCKGQNKNKGNTSGVVQIVDYLQTRKRDSAHEAPGSCCLRVAERALHEEQRTAMFSSAARAHEALRSMVMVRGLKPGTSLRLAQAGRATRRSLCAVLDLSRSPSRAALRVALACNAEATANFSSTHPSCPIRERLSWSTLSL